MADLVVELYGTRAGVLSGPWRTFDFVLDPAAVARFGIDSTILSVAIPLTAVAVRSRKARRQIFFRELVPEGRMLARLAQQAGVVDQDRHAALTKDHLITEGRAWGLANAAELAEETLTTVLQVATTQSPREHAHTELAQDIARFTANLLAGRAVEISDHTC